MAKYLVKHSALVGRSKADGGVLPAVQLVFFSIVEATNVEAANDLLVQYKDPGFTTRVESVEEITDSTGTYLLEQLQSATVLREQEI